MKNKKMVLNLTLKLSVIERINLLQVLNIYKCHGNIEMNDIHNILIPNLRFTDDEIEEFQIKENNGVWRCGDNSEEYNRTIAPRLQYDVKEFTFTREILKKLYTTYIIGATTSHVLIIYIKILNAIVELDYDLTKSEKENIEYSKIYYKDLTDIKTVESMLLSLLDFLNPKAVQTWNEKDITLDDIKTVAEFIYSITFTDDELAKYKIEEVRDKREFKITSNVDDKSGALRKLKTRTVKTSLLNDIQDIIYKIGINSEEYKLCKYLKLVKEV